MYNDIGKPSRDIIFFQLDRCMMINGLEKNGCCGSTRDCNVDRGRSDMKTGRVVNIYTDHDYFYSRDISDRFYSP
jgi:hypothetical protein